MDKINALIMWIVIAAFLVIFVGFCIIENIQHEERRSRYLSQRASKLLFTKDGKLRETFDSKKMQEDANLISD